MIKFSVSSRKRNLSPPKKSQNQKKKNKQEKKKKIGDDDEKVGVENDGTIEIKEVAAKPLLRETIAVHIIKCIRGFKCNPKGLSSKKKCISVYHC